jgi:carbonic anhydrase
MDVYLQRNEAFAATDAKLKIPAIPFIPFKQVYVLTCVDPRVEPAAIIGAQLGEAIIARNIGGRVTDSVVRDLAWICHLHENKTPGADWFELAIIHHTDCGSALFADPDLRRTYAARGGYDEQTAAAMAVLDPPATVAADVELLRTAPALAGSIGKFKVGGYAYDLKTGLLTTVVEPRRSAATGRR